MTNAKRWAFGLVLTLGLLAIACGGEHDAPVSHPFAPNDGPKTIVVEARATRFVPDLIEVGAGETVRLVLRNVDTETDHDLQAVDLEVTLDGEDRGGHGNGHGESSESNSALAVHVAPDEEGSITFVANEPGTYRIFCTVDNHKELGMVGTIVVT